MHVDAWEKEMDGLMTSALDGHRIRITIGDSGDLWMEAAVTPESKEKGLAARSELPHDGMIFIYHKDHTAPFTLAEMKFPIQLYFFDRAGSLVHAAGSVDGNLIVHSPVPYRFVVEVSDTIILDGDLALHEIHNGE